MAVHDPFLSSLSPGEGGSGVGGASPGAETSSPVEELLRIQKELDKKYGKSRLGDHVLFKTREMAILHEFREGSVKALLSIEFYSWWGGRSGYTLVFDFKNEELYLTHWKADVSPQTDVIAEVRVSRSKLLTLYKYFLGIDPEKMSNVVVDYLPESVVELADRLEALVADWIADLENFLLASQGGDEDE